MNQLIFTNDVDKALRPLLSNRRPFVITDTNVISKVSLPTCIANAPRAVIPAGETHKTILTACDVWNAMTAARLTRRDSVVVCFGGGVVTDLGGFTAATFKRGIGCINIPTTLLGAVDASVGGKTGVDFNGLKNQIGVFADPETVIVSASYFPTLEPAEFRSGLGEMLKHALLSSPAALSGFLADQPTPDQPEQLLEALRHSVAVKKRFVEADPHEGGLRKALNLGHTVGHALESLALANGSPITHGAAVARGLVAELVISKLLVHMNSAFLYAVARYVRDTFGPGLGIECDQYAALLDLMTHDKKNTSPATPSFTLLKAPGNPVIDQTPSHDDIIAALDIARDLLQ